MADDTETLGQRVAYQIVREVAELPDRTSPDGQPEMMLVTEAELAEIAMEVIAAANARLERERDEARKIIAGLQAIFPGIRPEIVLVNIPVFMREHETLTNDNSRLEEERDAATSALANAEGERGRMAAALEPFALVAETEIGGAEDDRDWFTTTALKLKVGHFRRALAALTPAPEEPKDGE